MFRFLIFSFLAFVPMSAMAQITCDPKPAGDVNIIWGSENIEYDFSKSQKQLDRMDVDTESPYDHHVKTHVGGLMKGGISIKSMVQVSTLTYPRSREICQWIGKMDVNVRIDPKIYIASDHPRGSCKHNAILEHEMKHIFVDREIVKKYTPIIKRELESAVRKVGIVGPKKERSAQKYQNKITAYMDKTLKAITDKMYAERGEKQQGVDTLKEYERVAGVCG
jgi:hypothetical protein